MASSKNMMHVVKFILFNTQVFLISICQHCNKGDIIFYLEWVPVCDHGSSIFSGPLFTGGKKFWSFPCWPMRKNWTLPSWVPRKKFELSFYRWQKILVLPLLTYAKTNWTLPFWVLRKKLGYHFLPRVGACL